MNRKEQSPLQRKIHSTLERAGEKSLRAEALTKSANEVRKAGAKRLIGKAAASVVAVVGLGVVGNSINNAMAREDEFYQQQDQERQEQIANNAPDPTMPHVTHPVQQGENPWTIAEQYTVRPQDTQSLANDIQAQLGDQNGNIHPNDVANITPNPKRDR